MRIYFEKNSTWLLMPLILVTSLGSLVKITTMFPIIIWLAFVLSWGAEFRFRIKSIFAFCLSLFAACIPTILWTNYADSIKRDNPFAEWLTSENLRYWNFGSLSQRLSEEAWVSIFARIWLIGGISALIVLPLLFVFLLEVKRGMQLLAVVALPLISPLVYFNLYVVHDYYFLAILFPTILSLALLIKLAQRNISNTVRKATFASVLLLLLAPSWIFTIPNRDYKVFISSNRDVIPPLALEIEKHTLPQDRIYVIGCDWDPSVLFYAKRYGIAVPNWIGTTENALTYLKESRTEDESRYLAVCDNSSPPIDNETYRFKQVSPNIWRFEATT